MTKEETYKKALEKISRYGIEPTSETKMQRIRRLKGIADKALFIANVSNQRELLLAFAGWLYGNLDKEVEERIVDDYLNSK